jgi:peroxiredoxin
MDLNQTAPPPDPGPRPRIGLAIASLVLGLLAVFGSILLVGALVGLLAVILGLIHISKRRGPNALAYAGIGLALLGMALSCGFGLLYAKGFDAARKGWQQARQQNAVRGPDTSPEFANWIGREAPDFTVTSLEGEEIRLSDLQGRRVVLDFWATWCSPCRREIPHFIQLTEEHSDDELIILGISDEAEDRLAPFVEENGVNYPIASAQDLPPPFGAVVALPTTFFIDRNGVIQTVLVGYHDYDALKAVAITADHSPD